MRREDIAKTAGKELAEEGGKLSKKLRERIKSFFNRFRSQHVGENPILAEVWDRALKRLKGNKEFAPFFEGKKVADDVMKKMYATARGHVNDELATVVEELEKSFKTQLKNRITELPANVQVHHILYKSFFPELAVAKENLILALRKTGGTLDELHDLFHLISSGAQGNRWRTLKKEIADLLGEVYGL